MKTRTLIGVTLAVIAIAATTMITPAASAASPATTDEITAAACARTYNDTTEVRAANGTYWYGRPTHHTVDCATISIRVLSNNCADYRIRFFPSSGGSTTNGWRNACHNAAVNLATNVLHGTEYRVESTPGPRTFRVRD